MDLFLSISIGLGLAAACGFRVFVPLLVMSVASNTGHLQLTDGFEWIGSLPAVITFASATALEIGAYYIPWVDNLLDTVSAPAAVVAGSVATASMVSDVDPYLKWSLAIIGGGGAAGVVKGASSMIRGASTLTTGGLANPLVSTAEAGGAVVLAGISIVLPVLALALVAVAFIVLLRKMFQWWGKRQQTAEG